MSRHYYERPNPYQSPSDERLEVKQQNPLLIPAVILLVLGSLWMLFLLVSIPSQALRMSEIDTSIPGGKGQVAGGVVSLIGWLAMTAGIIWGSIAMLSLARLWQRHDGCSAGHDSDL